MFLGEYDHNIDDKGRLAVPARFREELGEGVVITRGFDRCLMGFPRPMWEQLAQQVSALSLGQGDARNMRRLLFSPGPHPDPTEPSRVRRSERAGGRRRPEHAL
jgi:transcriptional regulator MraZ